MNILTSILLIPLLVLRDKDKALYECYVESPSVADQVIDFIGQGLSEEERQNRTFCYMIGSLIAPVYDYYTRRGDTMNYFNLTRKQRNLMTL